MNKLFKSYAFNISLIIGLSIFVLWLSLKNDYQQMIELLTNINRSYLLLILFMSLLVQLLTGLILTKLIRKSNSKYSYFNGIICGFVGSFFSGITPSSTGGQMAQVYVLKKQKVDYHKSISVLWMDFIIYQCVLCVFVCLLFILRFSYFFNNYSQFFLVALLGFLVNVTIIVALWLFVKYPKMYQWISFKIIHLGFRLRIVKDVHKTCNKLEGLLTQLVLQIKCFNGEYKLVIECVCLHLLRLLVYYMIPLLCFMAIGIEIDFTVAIDCIALASFVSMMNAFIPIPGASGGTEVTYVLMFATIFGTINAKSTMLIWRFVTYYLVLMIGALAFLWIKLHKGD